MLMPFQGQFASKAFDGDPYIEIMRVLPDKELCWWIQKVIWVAEGFTLLEHMGRTYPKLFIYKCGHCNGAGTVTCPHCNGLKIKKATSHNGFRLSEQTDVGRLLATAGSQECDHCGGYCQWDVESEWQGMWKDWESKLAYYDRSRGKIMDNWYEDVQHEGRLDDDTQEAEQPELDASVTGILADQERSINKMPERTKALMQRFGGHPYENFDMIPCQILDPTRPLDENIERMGMDYNWLPPELDPTGFPELLLQANNPIAQFEHQIRMEYLIMSNLDAAIKDEPKPALFGPTAGTVACPSCRGAPVYHSFTPNMARMFRAEPPFWLRTLTRMGELGTLDVSAAAHRRRQPAADASTSDAASRSPPSRGGGSVVAEVPNHPFGDVRIQAALDSAGELGGYQPRSVASALDQDYGPRDPLGFAATSSSDGTFSVPPVNPISGSAPGEAARIYKELNPAKNLARRIRDVKQLGGATTPEEKAQLQGWLMGRDSVANL